MYSKYIFRQLYSQTNNLNIFFKRCLSTNYGLVYEQYGNPLEVLKKCDISDKTNRSLKTTEVLLAYKASPINPADINTIQGVYAIKPIFPAIGGNEGVAQVVEIGSQVKNLKVGDHVIPSTSSSGTWRTYAILEDKDLILIDKEIDLLMASQLTVNPCTAYRMLKDFVNLNKGDTVVQNGANSAVGVYAIQLAKEWQINTVNVVRDRPDFTELKQRLLSLGATYVITEEELRQKDVMEEIWKSIPKPKLALNCIGGKNATDCMRHLDHKGVMVTYGGMSKQPLIIPTGAPIFKDNRFFGFWMTRWYRDNSGNNERHVMMKNICDLIRDNKLEPPKSVAINLDDYKEAIEKSMAGYSNTKYVFTMN
ncbi:enoyl-[acyl-carrier-protein] reductase, mitochondrial-like [Oppia nitens]|uniref:enoyl-[acyl-carrier-protein] reductase, mitochondrial-like n=1 Tax=Oppia nitens TaxID=1686743 RepID=UPI0023DB8192|nr:enoyl-[acyl-carrier-protein] reductase, mitochondrial-like [Oppia nitens]